MFYFPVADSSFLTVRIDGDLSPLSAGYLCYKSHLLSALAVLYRFICCIFASMKFKYFLSLHFNQPLESSSCFEVCYLASNYLGIFSEILLLAWFSNFWLTWQGLKPYTLWPVTMAQNMVYFGKYVLEKDVQLEAAVECSEMLIRFTQLILWFKSSVCLFFCWLVLYELDPYYFVTIF